MKRVEAGHTIFQESCWNFRLGFVHRLYNDNSFLFVLHMVLGPTLYLCVASAEPNNLPQSDSGSAQWSSRELTSSLGSARGPIKTTPIMVSDFMSSDATEVTFISLCSWGQTQQSPAIRSRIRAVVVEGSAIGNLACRHSTPFSPVTLWIIALWRWILYRRIAGIEPWNLHVSYSGSVVWLWWSVAALAPKCGCSGCRPGLGVWMLCVVIKRLYRVRSCFRLSAEKALGTRECYGYHSLSHWSELAFSHIQTWCSENRTLSASVPLP